MQYQSQFQFQFQCCGWDIHSKLFLDSVIGTLNMILLISIQQIRCCGRFFLLSKVFREVLNKTISVVESDINVKVTYVSTSEIASFRFPQQIFLNRKLCFNRVSEEVLQKIIGFIEKNLKSLYDFLVSKCHWYSLILETKGWLLFNFWNNGSFKKDYWSKNFSVVSFGIF